MQVRAGSRNVGSVADHISRRIALSVLQSSVSILVVDNPLGIPLKSAGRIPRTRQIGRDGFALALSKMLMLVALKCKNVKLDCMETLSVKVRSSENVHVSC